MTIYLDHLRAAWAMVQRGSPSAGIDGITLELFAGVAEERLSLLYQQLRQGCYWGAPAKGFYLPKHSGGQRLIGIHTVRDRILQRYLLNQTYPRFESAFQRSCHAYRPQHSIYSAVEQMMAAYQRQPAWVLKADIQQFFDQLSWPLLLTQLERLGIAAPLLSLLEQQIKTGIVVDGRLQRRHRGVLQGSVLSGALANLYLSDFDQRCLESGFHWVRYGDDGVSVFPSAVQARRALALMEDWLAELYLSLHPQKTLILGPEAEFTFLGHQFARGERLAEPRRARAQTERKRQPLQPVGPPKACSMVKSAVNRVAALPETYWSEPMTTLYVTDQGAYVRIQHQQFQVFHERELKCSIPANQISHVVLFGCSNLSHGAVSVALQQRIPVLYLSSNGRYFGRLETSGVAQVEYLTQQVKCSQDPAFALRQARSLLIAKVHNARVVLQRLNRRRKTDVATAAIAQLSTVLEQLSTAESIETMRGHEGNGARIYFAAYASLLKGPFALTERNRRPPKDPVNSLLSLGYTLLSQNVHAMVEGVGLHTHFGCLHTPRKNQPGLVCDLVEEFRAPIVDSFVAYLVNSKIFTPEDFTPPDARGGVYLHPDGLKRFLKHWEEHLQKQIKHPPTGYKVSYRRCFELQVWEYVACLTGEQDTYRAMRWEK